jgi:hypothetical protein
MDPGRRRLLRVSDVLLIESRLDLGDPDELGVELLDVLAKLCSERVHVSLAASPFRHQAVKVGTRGRCFGSQGPAY